MNKLYSLFTAIALVFTFELPASANRSVMEGIEATNNAIYVATTSPNGYVNVGGSITASGLKLTYGVNASTGVFSGAVSGTSITGTTGTFTGNAFSVGGSTFVVTGGRVGIGVLLPDFQLATSSDVSINENGIFGGLHIGAPGFQASILYNTNGNLDITPRAGFNTTFPSGNVGIGNTASVNLSVGVPNPTTDTLNQIFAGGNGIFLGQNTTNGEADIGNNFYYNGGWKYRFGQAASRIGFSDNGLGDIDFITAPSGAANSAITWTTRATFRNTGGLTMSANNAITLSGASGDITTASSVTASAFFGDGSHLTGVATSSYSYTDVFEPSLSSTSYTGKCLTSGTTQTVTLIAGQRVEVFIHGNNSNGTTAEVNTYYFLQNGAVPTRFNSTPGPSSYSFANCYTENSTLFYTCDSSVLLNPGAGTYNFCLGAFTQSGTLTINSIQFGVRIAN